jgi:hypothetical protein
MSPLQPMIWALIVIGFAVGARWLIARPSGPLFSRHAERMTKAADHMWETGDCYICLGKAFDHTDHCDLHQWLGGDS